MTPSSHEELMRLDTSEVLSKLNVLEQQHDSSVKECVAFLNALDEYVARREAILSDKRKASKKLGAEVRLLKAVAAYGAVPSVKFRIWWNRLVDRYEQYPAVGVYQYDNLYDTLQKQFHASHLQLAAGRRYGVFDGDTIKKFE